MKITWDTHTSLVNAIIRQMSIVGFKPEYVVGIDHRGSVAASMIAEYFGVKMYGLSEDESNCWMSDDSHAGKNILVVSDSNVSNDVLSAIQNDWIACQRPDTDGWDTVWNSSTRFAVLVEDISAVGAIIDFSGMELNTDEDTPLVTKVQMPWEKWWVI